MHFVTIKDRMINLDNILSIVLEETKIIFWANNQEFVAFPFSSIEETRKAWNLIKAEINLAQP